MQVFKTARGLDLCGINYEEKKIFGSYFHFLNIQCSENPLNPHLAFDQYFLLQGCQVKQYFANSSDRSRW